MELIFAAQPSAAVPRESHAALRAELQTLKPTALRRRARADGVSEEQIEEADDDEANPKERLVELILAAQPSAAVPRESHAALRAELQTLKPTALRRRARADGVSEEQIEEADDDEANPKERLVELILAAQRSTVVPRESHAALRAELHTAISANPSVSSLSRIKETLEHAVAICEDKTTGMPRRLKFEMAERLEALMELLEDDKAAARLQGANVQGKYMEIMALCQIGYIYGGGKSDQVRPRHA
eukprot:COSAG02_NODE_552_length_20429_cov_28.014068_8_plen_245_part_00